MEASQALAQAAQPGDSLQERIQKARQIREAQAITEFPIPGYGGVLVGRFHTLGWREQRKIIGDATRTGDAAFQELCGAADSIVAACDGIDAHLDGEVHDLNMKISVPLGVYLGLDMEGVDNDRQALFLIIPDEMQLIQLYFQLLKAWGVATGEIEDEITKNS